MHSDAKKKKKGYALWLHFMQEVKVQFWLIPSHLYSQLFMKLPGACDN